MRKALVIGSRGQIGIELVEMLQHKLGMDNVWGADIHETSAIPNNAGNYSQLNVLDKEAMHQLVVEKGITEVYQLAALLSATGEKNPMYAWKLNMEGLLNILEIAKETKIKLFWPSSIAAFGPTTPFDETPQRTIMEPTSVYGISKQAGERWCEYYFLKYGVDVRSIRYPGLIGYKSAPGGGTTDYAVDIFYAAIEKGSYSCFLQPNTALHRMMMDDAIRATIELMEAPIENIQIRGAYNLAGVSFTPAQLANEIKKHIPTFEISYYDDFRQQLADSWPNSIDDTQAQKDWNWKINFPLETLVNTMLSEIKKKIS